MTKKEEWSRAFFENIPTLKKNLKSQTQKIQFCACLKLIKCKQNYNFILLKIKIKEKNLKKKLH